MNEHDMVLEWLQKSADDLYSAEVLQRVGMLANSCYHAQQAGEKALKAYLVQCEQEVPYTHNLGLLCKLCMQLDETFAEIFQASSALTDYATITRYPGGDAVDEEETELAIQHAGRVFVFTQQRIPGIEQETVQQQELTNGFNMQM
ncbi:MAG: HEPN domain-containing protein [Oscillospiraceae bacterium]|nr:HEPN domain-containing protein [Oscillospiraceae bacterium]